MEKDQVIEVLTLKAMELTELLHTSDNLKDIIIQEKEIIIKDLHRVKSFTQKNGDGDFPKRPNHH